MSRTHRNYETWIDWIDPDKMRRDGLDRPLNEKRGRTPFPGYSLDGVWRRKTKKFFKRLGHKRNRKKGF